MSGWVQRENLAREIEERGHPKKTRGSKHGRRLTQKSGKDKTAKEDKKRRTGPQKKSEEKEGRADKKREENTDTNAGGGPFINRTTIPGPGKTKSQLQKRKGEGTE